VSDCHGLRGHACPSTAKAPLPPTSAALLGQSGQLSKSGRPGQANADSALGLAPVATLPGLVVVQVPLEVQWATNTPLGCGPPNAAVAVLSHNVDTKIGAVSMDLRVVLSPPGTSPERPSSTHAPQSRHKLRQSASPAAALQRAKRSPGELAAERRGSVCRH